MNFRRSIIIGCVILGAFSFCQPLSAEDVTVEATVSDTSVELGSSVQLTVTINGADAVPPLQLPKIDGLETHYMGPSTRISIINGKMSRSTGLNFSVIPLKTGQLQIPAIPIAINGKDYATAPISISVVNAGSLSNAPSQAADKNTPSSLQEKIFIVLGTPKKEAYLSEPIPVVIKLFINNLSVKNVQFPTFEHDGFAVDDFGEPRQGQQTLGDVNYQVMQFQTYIYPTRAGDLTLGPAKMAANIIIKSPRRQNMPGGDINDIFNDDIFDSFMGRFETKTVTLGSANIGIKVLPLPDEGKPADFSGGVGKFNFEMTVGPTTVKVGDPITVRMRVAGDGNLKSINIPAFKDSQDFKVYDPKITQQNGEKVLEQVVIPNNDKITELPAVHFSFFDPADKQYRTLTKGPFPLTVAPIARGEESKIVGMSAANTPAVLPAPAEELGQDIHFIKENIGELRKRGTLLCRSSSFVLVFGLSFLLWLGLFIYYEFRKKLSSDIRLARRWHAPHHARKGLAEAGRFLHENDPKKFYDGIFKTLQEYFGNKFHLSSATITVDVIASQLKSQDKAAPALATLREILAECDLVRFASAEMPAEKMKNIFEKTQVVIDFFERNYK